MPSNWSRNVLNPKISKGSGAQRPGQEPPLVRLVRLAAEEQGVHGFVLRATADNGVVEEARAMARALLQGQGMPAGCQKICQRFGVAESLLLDRVWAVASLAAGSDAPAQGPYEILGVDPWADLDTIKSAYRKLCRQCHPDLNPDDPEAAKRFQQLKAAYDMVVGNAGAQGWTHPLESSVWEDCPPRESAPSAWMRMRPLFPLATVVLLLVMAVGFADILLLKPRPRSAPMEAARPSQSEAAGKSLFVQADGPGKIPGIGISETSRLDGTTPPYGESSASQSEASGKALVYGSRQAAGFSAQGAPDAPGDAGVPLPAPAYATKSSEAADAGDVLAGRDAQGLSVEGWDDLRSHSLEIGLGNGLEGQHGGMPESLASVAPDTTLTRPAPSPQHAPIAQKPKKSASPGRLEDAAEAEGGKKAQPRPIAKAVSAGGRSPTSPPVETAPAQADPRGREAGKNATPTGVISGKERAGGALAGPDVPRDSGQGLGVPGDYVHVSEVMERVQRFLETYSRDYSRRDLRAFLAHFTPHAKENGTLVTSLEAVYAETFKAIPIMRYSIDVERWTLGSEGVTVQGSFEMRGAFADGGTLVSSGTLGLELVPSGSSYQVKNLTYSFR